MGISAPRKAVHFQDGEGGVVVGKGNKREQNCPKGLGKEEKKEIPRVKSFLRCTLEMNITLCQLQF